MEQFQDKYGGNLKVQDIRSDARKVGSIKYKVPMKWFEKDKHKSYTDGNKCVTIFTKQPCFFVEESVDRINWSRNQVGSEPMLNKDTPNNPSTYVRNK